ncbi:MAG: MFS transporter [Bacteroidota bacterium]
MKKINFLNGIAEFNSKYWLLNLIQMTERLSYYIVIIQLPIYIAQKDDPGGLHWDQAVKGMIFFVWAMVQNLTPVITGGLADRYGRKNFMLISYFLVIAGFIILGSQRDFWPFLTGALILGVGLGTFKPALQGSVASILKSGNAAIGWGIYVMLINIAVFAGGPFSKFLKSFSWEMVFYGAAIVFSLNFILTIFLKDNHTRRDFPLSRVVIHSFKNVFTLKIGLFVILMSGFTIIYMQFYETLPNFIYDWSDTGSVASFFSLPSFMTFETPLGEVISYEWLYNINSGLIIIGVVFFSWIFSKFKMQTGLIAGILISAAGLTLAGFTMYGALLMAGMMVYTVGEMITNPKFNEFMGRIAPEEDRSLFMGYMNISWAIGLGGGSLLGGWLYQKLGEKSGFAIQYLKDNFGLTNINHNEALEKMSSTMNISRLEASKILWQEYDPWMVWIPFLIIGIAAAFGLAIYSKLLLKNE